MTAAFIKTEEKTYLGTSHGRLIAVENMGLLFITDSLMLVNYRSPRMNVYLFRNYPVKRIAISNTQEGAKYTILLLFENGSIVNFKNKNRFMLAVFLSKVQELL